MKFIFKYLPIVVILVLILFSQNAFAIGGETAIFEDNTAELLNTTELSTNYSIQPKTELKNSKTDNTGNWYYTITAEFKRSLDEDVYLILQRTRKSDSQQDYTDLCLFQKGAGPTRKFTYPDCSSTKINKNIFSSDYTYRAWLSEESKGMNIDENGTLIYFDTPIPSPVISDDITISSASAEKSGDKNYYKIVGNIASIPNGEQIIFRVAKNGSSTYKTIGIVSKAGSFTTPSSEQLSSFSGLEPGSYSLRISKSTGALIKDNAYNLPEIGSTNNNNNNDQYSDPFASSQVVSDIRSGTGLVKQDCGYNLKESGKMCGFNDFISLIQRIIEYIFVLVLPIAAIVFAYAGFLYMTSGEDSNKRTAAKNAMTNLIIGIAVIMLAWIIVRLVLKSLGVADGFSLFLDIM